MTKEFLEPPFAVFNGHTNNAFDKANEEFIRMFGQEAFDKEIDPLLESGIMEIFDPKYCGLSMHGLRTNQARARRLAWIAMVTVLVNEK